MKAKDVKVVHGLLVTVDVAELSQVMHSEDYSSLDRLLSVSARVLNFCRNLKIRVHPEEAANAFDGDAKAEELWILEAQRALVADPKFKHWQKQLDLFEDANGIWRCRGRIQNAAVSYATKHPILLPSNHHVSTLFVRKAHERVLHNGVKETLTELRSKFWMIKGRSFVRKILHQCCICRRHEGKPYRAPLPPPLPSFRVEEAPPFSYTGIDFAGPLYVKCDGGMTKVWICLYTCCVVRAVHLDLVPDLTTPAFIRSLKRFTARRGLPCKILSDNGKTFKAAAKAIHAVVNHAEVQKYLSGLGVKWIFNLPKAPWWGGVFERMVRSTKRCLRKIIGQAKFSHDELLTALTEVEMVVNSRPLSYVSSDDLDEPLTPSHLMVGRRLLSFPDHLCPELEDFEATPDFLTRRTRYLNATINRFWERWRREYLLELREAHRQHKGDARATRISVGDIVIVHNEDQPRGLWKLGLVEETVIGADGEPRGAILRVASEGRRATHLHRPIQRLYPLEVTLKAGTTVDTADSPSNVEIQSQDEPGDTDAETPATEPRRQSRRAAASIARDRLLAQMLDEDD
jgi:hypothetical protein